MQDIVEQMVSDPLISAAIVIVLFCLFLAVFLVKRQRKQEDRFFHMDPS